MLANLLPELNLGKSLYVTLISGSLAGVPSASVNSKKLVLVGSELLL